MEVVDENQGQSFKKKKRMSKGEATNESDHTL
jgi:hypothetical protein